MPVTISSPLVNDNCAVQSLTWQLTGATVNSSPNTGINDVSGQSFNVGITTVTYTATDVNDNTINCSFTVSVVEEGNLFIDKQVDIAQPAEDDLITYTITVRNDGANDRTDILAIDNLPAGVTFVSADSNLGVFNAPDWTIPLLMPGEEAILLIVASVDQGTNGTTITNIASVGLETASVDITVSGVSEAQLPVIKTGISPNGDGKNDYLIIHNIELYPENTLKIYNRWGNLIFKKSGYGQDNVFFNGKSSGNRTLGQNENIPAATYFYLFDYQQGNETKMLSGYLYVLDQ